MFDRSQGYIIIHRKILEWEWYDDANTMRVFFHLLISANHKPNKWRGILIDRGQVITTYELIAKTLNLSTQSVRSSITKLKSTGELTIIRHPFYGLYTLTNYSTYQPTNSHSNNQSTINQQSINSKQ